MTYTVIWRGFLLARLAELYVAASDLQRQAMADGVEQFNDRLAADPFEVGESRDDDLRVAFPPLLCVYFQVDKVRRIVRVATVTRYGS